MCLPLKHLEKNRLAKGEHLGFEWEIVHNGGGYRCGYIRVLPGHPWYGKTDSDYYTEDYDRIPGGPSCHGGVTFSDYGKPCSTHGEKDEWWIGFDCAHAGDGIDLTLPFDSDKVYRVYSDMERPKSWEEVRDTEYVKAECLSLCEQADAVMATVG